MRRDAEAGRGGRPFVFTDLPRLQGVDHVVAYIEEAGGLAA